jgi:CheY-like chemotaxis protein
VTTLRILVVDDNRDTAELTAELLATDGHEVRTAGDGPAALALIDGFHPQIVLLDIELPGMNGYELAGHIRALPAGRELRLVAVTGYGRESDRRRALEAGFDEHVVKPMDIDRLQQALRLGPRP